MKTTSAHLVLTLALAATSVAVATEPSDQVHAASGDRIELAPPDMDMDAQDVPLFAGESGYLFYIDEFDRVLRWKIDGSADPLALGRAPNGIDAVSPDGSRYRDGGSVYVITGDTYERLRPPDEFYSCPAGEGPADAGYSPSLQIVVAVCDGGDARIHTYGGDTRTFNLTDLPDGSRGGDVVVNEDGSFRLMMGKEGSIFGPGTVTVGQFRVEYDENARQIGVRLPQKPSDNTAAFYNSRSSSDSIARDIDPIGGAGFETATGQVVPFGFEHLQPPPRVKRDDLFPPGTPLFHFTNLHALTATGFGVACLRAPSIGEPRWCYEGDFIDGGGRWFEHTIGGFDVGSITGDGKWYSRKTSASSLFVQQVVFAAGPNERVCFDVAGDPGDYAVVNLTPVEARGGGFARLISHDLEKPPSFSNANFNSGSIDPNVAIAPIGTNGQVCVVNSEHTTVHLIADHLGTIKRSGFTPARPNGTPERKIDTRTSGRPAAPNQRVCFDVAGDGGDYAVVNLTPVEAGGGGFARLVSSALADPPSFSNANFVPGSVDPNVAIARIGGDGEVCVVNSEHTTVHVIADHLGTIKQTAFSPARPDGTPERKIDTRTTNRPAAPNQRVCFDVTGKAGDYAVVNLTPVEAGGGGFARLVSHDLKNPPSFSNTNFVPGSIDPNVAMAPIGANGQVCIVNSEHTTVHLIADHLGTIKQTAFTPARPNGTPQRKIDTRPGG